MGKKNRKETKTVTVGQIINAIPEVLGLTNFQGLTALLRTIKEGKHPTIKSGSAEHKRIQAIKDVCNDLLPTNQEKVCKECGSQATRVSIINQGDGYVVLVNELYCDNHEPNATEQTTRTIRLSSSYGLKGQQLATMQKLVREAFEMPRQITEQYAIDFFANHVRTDRSTVEKDPDSDTEDKDLPWWIDT